MRLYRDKEKASINGQLKVYLNNDGKRKGKVSTSGP